MIDTLITSKTRIKILLKFFLNSNTSTYLRNLETEFGESTNSIRIELNKFEESGLLKSSYSGNKKLFKVNQSHPMYTDIRNIIMKYTGLDQIIEQIIRKLGVVHSVYLIGDLARGIKSKEIDLVFVGDIELSYLKGLIHKAEHLTKKKINYQIFSKEEFETNKEEIFKKSHFEIIAE